MAVRILERSSTYSPTGLTDAERITLAPGFSGYAAGPSGTDLSSREVTASGAHPSVVVAEVTPRWILVSPQPPAWVQPTLQSLDRLMRLPDNWDRYGACRVHPSAAFTTLRMLAEVMTPETPSPSIVPTSKGGLQLEWHRNGVDLEIEAVSMNRVSFYVRNLKDGSEREGEWTSDLRELRSILRQVTSR